MKVRLIGGIREADSKDPLMGLELQVVAFPMTVPNYGATGTSDPEELTLHDEEQLQAWADKAYDDMGYEIFKMEVPALAQDTVRLIPDLISSKKAEYENASAPDPTAAAERDAVLAALDTLETHARNTTEAAHSVG